jgi:hypothetical protein
MQCEEIEMQVTESFAMIPGAAVSGFYFAHPQSKYFSVGKIGNDQVSDMATVAASAKNKSNAGSHRTCNSFPHAAEIVIARFLPCSLSQQIRGRP